MEETVNQAVNTAAAGVAHEPASTFAFAPSPASPEAAGGAAGEQKGAGAVDAQRSADAQGKEPRRGQPQQDQKQIGNAFKLESERVRKQARAEAYAEAKAEYEKKAATDPVRAVGLRVVTSIMRETNMTLEEAAREADKRFYDGIAAREKISPAMARVLFKDEAPSQMIDKPDDAAGKKTAGAEPAKPGDEGGAKNGTAEQRINHIVSELQSMQLPDGFDMEAACKDEAFLDLLMDPDNTPKAAVRIYHAEQRAKQSELEAKDAPQTVADQLRARSALPQQTKAGAPAGPKRYADMTSEEFAAEKKRLAGR